jgi:hypothetical protein
VQRSTHSASTSTNDQKIPVETDPLVLKRAVDDPVTPHNLITNASGELNRTRIVDITGSLHSMQEQKRVTHRN